MKFLEQIEFIVKKIQSEINRIIQRIRSYRIFSVIAAFIVILVTILLIARFGKDISALIGSLISLSAALLLNFWYSIFKENLAAKEKLKELDEKTSNMELLKNCEQDENVRKLVDNLFQKQF